jgi:intracellular sulfur oxidation DsrE/DsrF family protein
MIADRRSFLIRVGAGFSVSGTALPTAASAAKLSAVSFTPARHGLDDWMDKIPGKHRMVFDTTTQEGFGMALLFADNLLTANKDGYGLNEQDIAVIIIARHFSTPFAYNDAMWAKYGKATPTFAVKDDPKTKERPSLNPYKTAAATNGTTIDELTRRGVHFAVCDMATKFFSGIFAQAAGGSADRIHEELASNLIDKSHMVSAGIVALNRAQERAFTLAIAV